VEVVSPKVQEALSHGWPCSWTVIVDSSEDRVRGACPTGSCYSELAAVRETRLGSGVRSAGNGRPGPSPAEEWKTCGFRQIADTTNTILPERAFEAGMRPDRREGSRGSGVPTTGFHNASM
jgi:hypothetical protein